jgi:predicted PurR-regulated permease PerM
MSDQGPPSQTDNGEGPDLGASPSYIDSPVLRQEVYKAMVWVGVVGMAVLAVYISQSLLVIFGGLVFAAMIDGGARLLGKLVPLPRTARILLVLAMIVAFFVWLATFAGDQIARQAAELPALIESQAELAFRWVQANGFAIKATDLQSLLGQVLSGVGTLTRVLTGIAGWVTSIVLILIIGLYVALEPRLYERGVEWMAPRHQRRDLRITINRMAWTLRRLMAGRMIGMLFEGVFTYILLTFGAQLIGVGTVPMAALLAILTGLLAFVPNIGAIVSGVLMVTVGFSGGTEMGLYTLAVYFFVQNFDGYVVVPMIAQKTVDLAPALVLGAQLIMGLLFGILGLFLADPLLAMIKVALERRSERNAELQEAAVIRKLARAGVTLDTNNGA